MVTKNVLAIRFKISCTVSADKRRQRFKNKNFNLKTNMIMKTKTSIYHSPFAFAYVLLVAVIFCGCGEPAKQKENIISARRIDIHWFDENGYSSEEEFTVITIDSCEYLLAGYDRSRMITHKGNCKFCAERSKK